VMVGTATFLFAIAAFVAGFARFWRGTGGGPLPGMAAWGQALRDAATLRYLGGGGHGCNDADESFSSARRHAHHALAYGFLLCFAATTTGTIYHHFLFWPAPYPFLSLPVLLGTAGGIGMVAGCAGLFWLKLAGDQAPRSRALLGSEAALLVLLFLIAGTGLLLLAVRATGAMGIVLAVHLGAVLALFLTMPYGKFVHGIYRMAALVRHAAERPAA
jgi:citrate/tricarballylate utilization protein